MTELLWRWLHHTVAPHRTSQWFTRAAATAGLALVAASWAVRAVVTRADSVHAIPPTMVLPVLVASTAALTSFAWVVTAFASVRLDGGDALTGFPLPRTRRRVVLQVHTLVVQAALMLLAVPSASWVVQQLAGTGRLHAVAVCVAACLVGAAVGSVISLGAAQAASTVGSPSVYVGSAAVSWVLWFVLSGAAGRALLDGGLSWWMVPTGWAALTPEPSVASVAVMGIVVAVSLVTIPLSMAHFPEFPVKSHALVEFTFMRLPTFSSTVVRSARNAQVRAQMTAGLVLTGTLGGVLVWREGVQSQGMLALFGALFCSAIASQSRLAEGPVRRDWVVGLTPGQTLVPGLAAALLLCLPVTAVTVGLSSAEEGEAAAVAAGFLCAVGAAAGYCVASVLRPVKSNGTAELAIAALSLVCLAGVLYVAPFSAEGNP